jgi:hypothetical protein
MRKPLLLILLLAAAAPVAAQDRYGPAPVGNRGRTDALPPGMRTLNWAGKTAPTPPPSAQARAQQAILDPITGGALRHTSIPTSAPAPVQQASAAPADNAPWRRLTGLPQAVPQTPQARPSMPVEAQGPLPAAAPATASEQPEYRTDTTATSTPTAQGDQARYYSLHRDYGETPDPVAIPEKSQVFLAGGPLGPRLDEPTDEAEVDTGRTAAIRKARVSGDWDAPSDSAAVSRVQITRP